MEILHANQAARRIFKHLGESPRRREFNDLPQVIGSRVFEALRQGRKIEPFKYRPAEDAGNVYQVSIAPFEKRHIASPHAALVLIEDFTQIERWQKLDLEAASLRLIKLMAERLAHEIGNAVVPLSTHQQLFAQRYRDVEFRASLSDALSDGVRRVSRLVKQMYFLARDGAALMDRLPVRQLVEEAFRDAQTMHGGKTTNLHYEDGEAITLPACDKNSLRHALAEVMLNALQSDAASPQVWVKTSVANEADGRNWLFIDVLDNGAGFNAETSVRGFEPFFTTRNVGVGLGLTVCRKIIETHQGRLEARPEPKDKKGHVRIAIPFLQAAEPDVSIESFRRPLKSPPQTASPTESP
jgi:nitrogen fixation/metabolism regulation signal transduction histidine kinase